MKFVIDKVILWPKKSEQRFRTVDFKSDKINIITGASRTGKSAIIPIIDYCLGADKCTIPVDTIRNATAWFGVLISLDGGQLLLCRKEPGQRASTGEMYILRGNELSVPETVAANTTVDEVKNVLNELFSMSFLAVDPQNRDGFSARPSYRDFMAFLFQPQNIVANADVMFYKADTMEHRQRLINIFPYALGAVTPEILAARQELERIRKQRDRLQRELDTIKEVSENWKQEITSWLMQAKEMGLVDEIDKAITFEEQVDLLSKLVERSSTDSLMHSTNIRDLSAELVSLRKEEQSLSSKLFALQTRYTEMLQLKDSLGDYEGSLKIQLQRLEISAWLKELATTTGTCPFCNSDHIGAKDELDTLCEAIAEIEKSADGIKAMPAAFERELHLVQKDIDELIEKLTAVRKRIAVESGKIASDSDKKYTLSSISRFLGRMEASLQTFNKIGRDGELERQISELVARIEGLSAVVNEAQIRSKINAAIGYINQKIGEIVKTLDSEHPDDPVQFLDKDLTIKVRSSSGRDDYLWEIGSASNWLAYHVATILAFQTFFQIRGKVAVPNFVVFDQPSQVYFPQQTHVEDEKTKIKDEDKEAVRKIFTAMDSYLKQSNYAVQIIITEHADLDIWGGIESVHLVERWRGENKLIPQEWI